MAQLVDSNFNWAYMYGLSDFWTLMMEEPEVVASLQNANAVEMAEAYSRFLQLTSTMSLDEVLVNTSSQIKLLLIRVPVNPVTDVPYATYEVTIDQNIVFAETLSDKPILPTDVIETGVDFEFSEPSPGVFKLSFAEDIASYNFPYRQVTDDNGRLYNEYSFWASDVLLDDQLIYKNYASIIKINADVSSSIYKDYVRGLYFLFTQGPNLDYLERGLSLALGVPLARTKETVLLLTQDEQRGNWIVVTDRNSYNLPYGITPTVIRGQVLTEGETLAKIATVEDYRTNDNWWLNIYIPGEIFPQNDTSSYGGVATPGSDYDYIMRTYLKTHTFLVRIDVQPGSATGDFANLRSVIDKVKPSYTFAIYAWTIPIEDEIIDMDDEGEGDFVYNPNVGMEDYLGAREYIYKDEAVPKGRNSPWFIHSNTDAEYGILPEDCVQVDPDFEIAVADYLGTPGSAVATTYAKLMPLYNILTDELEAKLTALSIAYTPGDLPQKFALVGSYAGNATALTRAEISAPIVTGDYYSPVSDTYTDNIFNAQNEGFEPESHRSFFMLPAGLASPVTLVFMKMADTIEIFTVHAIHDYGLNETTPYKPINLPIQTEETLIIQQV